MTEEIVKLAELAWGSQYQRELRSQQLAQGKLTSLGVYRGTCQALYWPNQNKVKSVHIYKFETTSSCTAVAVLDRTVCNGQLLSNFVIHLKYNIIDFPFTQAIS